MPPSRYQPGELPSGAPLESIVTPLLQPSREARIEFYDKLPDPFPMAMPQPREREQALLWGLDLARRAAAWHTFPDLYAEYGIKSVRFAVSSHTRDIIFDIEKTFAVPRRIITGMALHYAMVDRFSPHFSTQIAAIHTRHRRIGLALKEWRVTSL